MIIMKKWNIGVFKLKDLQSTWFRWSTYTIYAYMSSCHSNWFKNRFNEYLLCYVTQGKVIFLTNIVCEYYYLIIHYFI